MGRVSLEKVDKKKPRFYDFVAIFIIFGFLQFLLGCTTTTATAVETRYHHAEKTTVTPLMFKCITVGGTIGCGSAGLDPTCLWQGDNEYICFTHESEWAWVGTFENGHLVAIHQQRLEMMH